MASGWPFSLTPALSRWKRELRSLRFVNPQLNCDASVVESVKAASDLVMPVSGELVAVNDALTQAPDLANSDPFGGAWMIKVRLDNTSDLAALLEPAAYEKFCESRAH